MKKLLSLLLTLLMCTTACAESAWHGPVLVGNLPKDAIVLDTGFTAEGGYMECLWYENITIAMGCLTTSEVRTAYLENNGYAADAYLLEEELWIAGQPATHTLYEITGEAGKGIVNCYTFDTSDGGWLFLTCVPETLNDADTQELVEIWAESLDVFQP